MTTVLVTGGAGYVGSHACKALAAAGWIPVVYDDLSTGHAGTVKWGPLVQGSLADGRALDAAFAAHRPDFVMHFAASAYVGESAIDPLGYYRNNVAGSVALLSAAVRAGCRGVVFSSSCTLYGNAGPPLTEMTPIAPINPYGRTKLAVEHILADVEQAHGLPFVALRYFNAAGADPDGDIGEDHDPETHLIPLAIGAAQGWSSPLEIFGTQYKTSDGTCVRDYVHVTDLADAHVRAIKYMQNGGTGTAFNLGSETGYSVREVIDTVARIGGKLVPHHEGPARDGDPARLVADSARAHEVLGWQAGLGDLDTVVRTAWDWFARTRRG